MNIPTVTWITNRLGITSGWQLRKVSIYQEKKVEEHLSSKGKIEVSFCWLGNQTGYDVDDMAWVTNRPLLLSGPVVHSLIKMQA